MKENQKKEFIRTVKYALFTSSAGIIELLLFTLLNQATSWSYWPCYLIALTASVLWNFTLNRRFTFRADNNVPIAMLKVFGYYLVFTPVSTIFGNYLVEVLLWNEYLITIINMLMNGITEFLYQRFFVYGRSVDTREEMRYTG